MKLKSYLLPVLSGVALLLSACAPSQDEVFSESASQRIENEIQDYRELLVGAPHGWIMEYYPGGTNQAYGGVLMGVSFSAKGTATFQSTDMKPVSKKAVSLYSLKKDVGATLNFDSYNDIFHIYADPDVADGGGRSKGYLGDYEFLLKSHTADTVIMVGKKHQNRILLRKARTDLTEILNKSQQLLLSYLNIPAVQKLVGELGGKDVEAKMESSLHYMMDRGKGAEHFSFIFTENEVRLYNPLSTDKGNVMSLTWDADARTFTDEATNTRLKIESDMLGLTIEDLLGNYTMTYNGNKTKEVSIAKEGSSYLLKGFPFTIELLYDASLGAFVISPQPLKENPAVNLTIWDSVSTYLTWDPKTANLRTLWNGDKENFVLSLVAGEHDWYMDGKKNNPNAFILWIPQQGEFKDFGESRFANIQLTKKK